MSSSEEPSEDAEDRELVELLQQVHSKELAETASEELAQRRSIYEYYEKHFGEKVRQWRRQRNWSQEEVADMLRAQGFDMHQTTVAKIERGTRPLRVAEAVAIATIFRVPPLAVFLGPPPELMPWSLNQLHDTVATAQNTLDEMKAEMSRSAERYVEQEAHVLALARLVNETALDAEMGRSGRDTTSDEGEDDDAEA
jgi:transcriptional regulator with XRE-family HTH domain